MSNRTKILITIDWFLPGTRSGGPVRSYANLIAHLKDDFEFYIITRHTDFGSDIPYKDIEPDTWVQFNSYTKVYYISLSQLNKSHLRQIITTTHFDVAYINGIYSWYFSILPLRLLKPIKKPIIISARGMLNPQAFSVKGTKKKIYLKVAKLLGVYNGVSFHATNENEANCIRNEIRQAVTVHVAPNLPRKFNAALKTNAVMQNPVRFVNVARVSIEKGTLKMIKALKEGLTPLSLDLYGPIYDKEYWDKCQAEIDTLPKHIDVKHRGVLESADVPKILCQYDFFMLLSEGENFGHAILEAFAVGLPVIISNKTPWRDLKLHKLGWDIDIDHLKGIKEAIDSAVKMSEIEYSIWSKSAYNYAKDFMSNPELIEQNKALFLNAVKKQ